MLTWHILSKLQNLEYFNTATPASSLSSAERFQLHCFGGCSTEDYFFSTCLKLTSQSNKFWLTGSSSTLFTHSTHSCHILHLNHISGESNITLWRAANVKRPSGPNSLLCFLSLLWCHPLKLFVQLQLTRVNYRLWRTVHRQTHWCVTDPQDQDQIKS